MICSVAALSFVATTCCTRPARRVAIILSRHDDDRNLKLEVHEQWNTHSWLNREAGKRTSDSTRREGLTILSRDAKPRSLLDSRGKLPSPLFSSLNMSHSNTSGQ